MIDVGESRVGSRDDKNGMSTAGIVLLVLFVDLLLLGAVGAVLTLRKRQRMRDIEAEYGLHQTNNWMVRGDGSEPPTLEDILSINRLSDSSERSGMNASHHSVRNSYYNGDEGCNSRDGAEETDLVNVAII